jgi:uncharacterized protein YjiS (DUF1127 family)
MNVARAFNTWRRNKQAAAELERLTCRELQDLGINRLEMRSLANR